MCRILDGSIQLLGKSLFVSNLYSFPRVRECFGEMARVKDESKIISTEKGETFSFPFYLTRPSLLIFAEFKSVKWRGKLPIGIPPSFIGLFYSFQHFIKVKIIWKSEITGEIGFTEEEIIFKVLNRVSCKNSVMGVLNDATSINKNKVIEELFDDDFVIGNPMNLIEEINRIKSHEDTKTNNDKEDYLRSLIESDSGYHRSISIEDENNSTSKSGDTVNCISTVHLRKSVIQPGTQIFMTIDVARKIDLIKLKIDCIESYPHEFVKPGHENYSWRESVKELQIIPGNRDRIEVVFPVPPELPASFSGKFVTLEWELLTSFLIGAEEFKLIIPIKFISLNLKLNKKRL